MEEQEEERDEDEEDHPSAYNSNTKSIFDVFFSIRVNLFLLPIIGQMLVVAGGTWVILEL